MRFTVAITGRRIVLAGLAGVLGALAVSYSGLVSIAANTGHFAIVEWFLHTTMRNAVRTQSLQYSLPEGIDLSDPVLVQRAAGHFASSCASCHGAPGVAQSPAVLAMMPPPPRLEGQIGRWEDRELFWIGQHGIKYSGMPAWVSQDRPDEVWSMVAFLRALPGMTPEAYRALALGGDDAAGPPSGLSTAGFDGGFESSLADCARCHGLDGLGTGVDGTQDAFPAIAGQSEAYLFEALKAYARGDRTSGIMQTAAGIHDDARLAELAAYYADQPRVGTTRQIAAPAGATLGYSLGAKPVREAIAPDAPTQEPAPSGPAGMLDPAAPHGRPLSAQGLADLGERIATQGLLERKLGACQSCHDGGADRNPAYPSLAGLPEWYIAAQLQLFKEEERGGGPFAHLMTPIAIHLTDEQIDALALWYSLQAP